MAEVNNQYRKYWLQSMLKIANPVLENLKAGTLKKAMPIEMKKDTSREQFSHLEALSRLLVGMAPWLEKKCENSEENALRMQYCELARLAIDAGTDLN